MLHNGNTISKQNHHKGRLSMSYNKTKCDPELGQRVHMYLVKMGVETPTLPNSLDRKDKIDLIE